MSDGRHTLTRKEPITIDVTGQGEQIAITPLPWRKRNELGILISKELNSAFDRMKEARTTSDIDAFYDYSSVLAMGTSMTAEQIENLVLPEVISICHWICEQNGLESLLWMLDPEVPAPQELQTSGDGTDGQKTPSTDDSSSPELDQATLKN